MYWAKYWLNSLQCSDDDSSNATTLGNQERYYRLYQKAKTKKPSQKLDVCKNFDNTNFKPTLPDDAPIAVVLFAGGGEIEAGMVQAGIRPVIAVEFDPTKPDLSRAIALNHHRNFHEYGCKIIQLTVQEVAQLGFIGFPHRPDYLHASPVCANFSQAHTAKAGNGIETADDLTAAIAIAEAIRQLQPRVFTLENVPRYQNSQSFAIILNALEQERYSVDYSVVNMADFGLPQARRRLVLVASKGFHVALPTRRKPIGWYEAIAHLIPIIAFIKKAKTKKYSPRILDVCKNFDNTKLKPTLPDDAPIAIVLFAGGGGIEAGMVQAGIRPAIAVEFDPSKPELSRAMPAATSKTNAKTHHRNFHEYGCKIIQQTVQEVAGLGFIGFPRRPDYLHASPVCANFSQAHTAKAGKGEETADDLSAAIAVAEAIRQLQPRVFTLENVPRYQNSQS